MSFSDLKRACDDFRETLLLTTKHNCIYTVTVSEPSGDEDELYFVRLVLWCYVFWFEACHPAGSHLVSLLKVGSATDYRKVDEIFRVVRSLRTATAHNLNPPSKQNNYTGEQASIWLAMVGGDPRDWRKCSRRLCEDAKNAVEVLSNTWFSVVGNPEDAPGGIERLLLALTRDWPAHAFDRMLEHAANSVGLTGLDLVAYRTKRIEHWRSLAAFFSNRNDAEVALQRAIRQELVASFGRNLPENSTQS
jgi:hypothetical protein